MQVQLLIDAGGSAAIPLKRRYHHHPSPPSLPASPPPEPQVYHFNVPTFGKGVVYDVDQRVRSEQFRFVADALRTAKLRTYVPAFKQARRAWPSNTGAATER